MLLTTNKTSRRHKPQDHKRHLHRSKDLRSQTLTNAAYFSNISKPYSEWSWYSTVSEIRASTVLLLWYNLQYYSVHSQLASMKIGQSFPNISMLKHTRPDILSVTNPDFTNEMWESFYNVRVIEWWEDTVKVGRKKTGWEHVNCIHLAQDRDRWRALVNKVMNLQVP
jgi:hypothetical protein